MAPARLRVADSDDDDEPASSLQVQPSYTQQQQYPHPRPSFHTQTNPITQEQQDFDDDDDDASLTAEDSSDSDPDSDEEEDLSPSQQLWPVKEILAEKKSTYLLAWEGVDPVTRKPWSPSWEPKASATRALVEDWERVKLNRRKGPGGGGVGGKNQNKRRRRETVQRSWASVGESSQGDDGRKLKKLKRGSGPAKAVKTVAFQSPAPSTHSTASDRDVSLHQEQVAEDEEVVLETLPSEDEREEESAAIPDSQVIVVSEAEVVEEEEEDSLEDSVGQRLRATQLLLLDENDDDEDDDDDDIEAEEDKEAEADSLLILRESASHEISGLASSVAPVPTPNEAALSNCHVLAGPKQWAPIRVPLPSAFFPPYAATASTNNAVVSSQPDPILNSSSPQLPIASTSARPTSRPPIPLPLPPAPRYTLVTRPSNTAAPRRTVPATMSTGFSKPLHPAAALHTFETIAADISVGSQASSSSSGSSSISSQRSQGMRAPHQRRVNPAPMRVPFPLLPGASQMSSSSNPEPSSSSSQVSHSWGEGGGGMMSQGSGSGPSLEGAGWMMVMSSGEFTGESAAAAGSTDAEGMSLSAGGGGGENGNGSHGNGHYSGRGANGSSEAYGSGASYDSAAPGGGGATSANGSAPSQQSVPASSAGSSSSYSAPATEFSSSASVPNPSYPGPTSPTTTTRPMGFSNLLHSNSNDRSSSSSTNTIPPLPVVPNPAKRDHEEDEAAAAASAGKKARTEHYLTAPPVTSPIPGLKSLHHGHSPTMTATTAPATAMPTGLPLPAMAPLAAAPLSPALSRVMNSDPFTAVSPVAPVSTLPPAAASVLPTPANPVERAVPAPISVPAAAAAPTSGVPLSSPALGSAQSPPLLSRTRSASPAPTTSKPPAAPVSVPAASRNASPAPGGGGGAGLPNLLELIKASSYIEEGDATKAELSKFVKDPSGYSATPDAPLTKRALWAFELRRSAGEKTDIIIVNSAEGSYQLKRVPLTLASTLDVAKSLSHSSSRAPGRAATPSVLEPVAAPVPIPVPTVAAPPAAIPSVLLPAPQPAEPVEPHASVMSREQLEQEFENLRVRAKMFAEELDRIRPLASETIKLRQENVTLARTNKQLSASKDSAQADFNYIQRQYQEASNAAVARANEATVAEAEAARLQGLLDFGLVQQKKFHAGEVKTLREQLHRHQVEVKLLREERRATDGMAIREAASKWHDHLERLKIKAEGGGGDSLDSDEEEESRGSSLRTVPSSLVFACEWRSDPTAPCDAVTKTKSELHEHVLSSHMPPTLSRLNALNSSASS